MSTSREAVAGGDALAPRDVLDLRIAVDARLSPRGDRVVYGVATVSSDGREDRVNLFVADVSTGESRQLTTPDALDAAPSWHPDGDRIVFRSNRGGAAQVFHVAASGGRPEALTHLDWGVGPLEPRASPGGRQVLFGAPASPPRDPSAPYRVTSALWRLDGTGLLRDAVQELFVVDSEGGEPQQLTDHRRLMLSAEWSPEGDRILYVTLDEADEPTFDLWVWDAESRQSTWLWEWDYEIYSPAVAWARDGKIVRSTTNRTAVSGAPPALVTTEPIPDAPQSTRTEGVPGWIFGFVIPDFECESLVKPRIVVAPGGREGLVAVQAGGRGEVWAFDLEGAPSARPVVAGDQVSVPLDADDERVLVATSTMYAPPDLWLVDRDGPGARRLTALNETRFPPGARFDVCPLTVPGEDSEPVEAWFLRPLGATGPVPTLLTIHGGPHAGWGHTFSFDNAMLCDAGYGILLVNPRGSTGYSQRFASCVHGHLGERDGGDLLRAVDVAVARGLADPEALGVWGQSYGGYLTGWLVTHSDRFRAAVAECAVLDYFGVGWASDVGYLFPEMLREAGTTGVPDPASRMRQSATTFAERCTTPTLIIQHERDGRVPNGHGDAFFTLLKVHGCETEMVRMPRTSHDGALMIGDPRTRVAQNEAVLDWFTRYLPARVVRA